MKWVWVVHNHGIVIQIWKELAKSNNSAPASPRSLWIMTVQWIWTMNHCDHTTWPRSVRLYQWVVLFHTTKINQSAGKKQTNSKCKHHGSKQRHVLGNWRCYTVCRNRWMHDTVLLPYIPYLFSSIFNRLCSGLPKRIGFGAAKPCQNGRVWKAGGWIFAGWRWRASWFGMVGCRGKAAVLRATTPSIQESEAIEANYLQEIGL